VEINAIEKLTIAMINKVKAYVFEKINIIDKAISKTDQGKERKKLSKQIIKVKNKNRNITAVKKLQARMVSLLKSIKLLKVYCISLSQSKREGTLPLILK
jgi:hypothetical protein